MLCESNIDTCNSLNLPEKLGRTRLNQCSLSLVDKRSQSLFRLEKCPIGRSCAHVREKTRQPLWKVDLTVCVDEDPLHAASQKEHLNLLLGRTIYWVNYGDEDLYGRYSLSPRRDSLTLYNNDYARLVPWWRFRFFSDLTFVGSKFGYWNYGTYSWFNVKTQLDACTKQARSKSMTYLRQRGNLILEFNTI